MSAPPSEPGALAIARASALGDNGAELLQVEVVLEIVSRFVVDAYVAMEPDRFGTAGLHRGEDDVDAAHDGVAAILVGTLERLAGGRVRAAAAQHL